MELGEILLFYNRVDIVKSVRFFFFCFVGIRKRGKIFAEIGVGCFGDVGVSTLFFLALESIHFALDFVQCLLSLRKFS